MRIATLAGRLAMLTANGAVDVERASKGRFAADPAAVYERWEEFRDWAQRECPGGDLQSVATADLGAPSPRPGQVFAIGLNYRDHAAEGGFALPESPVVFTKFVTCLTGPHTTLALPSAHVDWEVELVAVIGRRAENVTQERAWAHVAGLTAGQDYSERALQGAGPAPQFSLAKSFPGFGPTGPWLVTPDAFPDPDDLGLSCLVNDDIMQKSRTSAMIFPVPELIARLSAVCPLLPGDVVFTGTPAGIGAARTPPRFLAPGDEVISRIEGIGELRQTCTRRA